MAVSGIITCVFSAIRICLKQKRKKAVVIIAAGFFDSKNMDKLKPCERDEMKGRRMKMNIGIVVYSKSGNTLEAANMMREELESNGHTVSLEQVTAEGDPKPGEKVDLTHIPQVDGYDCLILGAPVHGFSLAPVMNGFVTELPDLQGKQVLAFVTKQLPMKWTGGTKALQTMQIACESKGGRFVGGVVLFASDKKRDRSFQDGVQQVCRLIQ